MLTLNPSPLFLPTSEAAPVQDKKTRIGASKSTAPADLHKRSFAFRSRDDVPVSDKNPLEAKLLQSKLRTDRYIVEEAKSHG